MPEFRSAILTLIIISVFPGIGRSQLLEINPKSGIYNSPIDVEIRSNGDFESIHYTLDGSEPGVNSSIYHNPIHLDKNTVLKVSAISPGGSLADISVASYFINSPHTLPIISLVTDPKYLWDNKEGIYVKGDSADSTFPFYGSNFWQDREIPVHIQMFELDRSLAFSQFAGAKIFGGATRTFAQKSLSIHTRKSYGKKNINYRIFPDGELVEFSRIVLRNSGNDWNRSMIRDGVISKLFHPSIDQQAFRSAVLYINGEYWGIHNIREKINEEYIESHYDINEDDFSILEIYGLPVHGDSKDYEDLLEFIENNDLSIPENYEHVESKIDINNFIYYQTANIYIDNRDWPAGNIKFWKQNSESGKWRWISFDRDFGFGYGDINKVFFNTLEFALEPDGPHWPNPPWSTLILRSLIKNESFRKSFINAFADQLNSQWKPENVKKHILNLSDQIEDEISRHFERWDSNMRIWQRNIIEMNLFAETRPEIMFFHIESTFDIVDNHQINLSLNNNQSGHILLNSITPESYPWEGTYFEGVPITLTAQPEPGYRFSKWEGDIQSFDKHIEVNMDKDMNIVAVFELENEALSSIVINEIFYKSEGKDISDWIEIFNRGQSSADLSNWTFNDGHPEGFKIPSNTIIQPGNFVVIAKDKENFQEVYGDNIPVVGNFNFGLSSFGECLSISDSEGKLADEVCYYSAFPWPDIEALASLALSGPTLSNSDVSNWFAQINRGSPGKHNRLVKPDLSFKVFPNPAEDYIALEFSENLERPITLSIVDLAGNLIEKRTVKKIYKNSFKMEFSDPIQPGLYLLSIVANGTIVTKRLHITQSP